MRPVVATAVLAAVLVAAVTTPAVAKPYVYLLTRQGALLKYDPGTNGIVSRRTLPRAEYLDEGGYPWGKPVAIDVARGRVVVWVNHSETLEAGDDQDRRPGFWVLDLATGRASLTGPPGGLGEHGTHCCLQQLVYLRRVPHFIAYVDGKECRKGLYVRNDRALFWVSDVRGKWVGVARRELCHLDRIVLHPDGRHFFEQPWGFETVRLVDGASLRTVARYDLTALGPSGGPMPRLIDAAGSRALFADEGGLFTTDLAFTPGSRSPGIPRPNPIAPKALAPYANRRDPEALNDAYVLDARLTPDGRLVVTTAPDLDERGVTRSMRLHVADAEAGRTLGTVTFPWSTPRQGVAHFSVLGFDPDGRRLYGIGYRRAMSGPPATWLFVIDLYGSAIVRQRPIDEPFFAVDVVEEAE